jgi:hypothetical protein
VTRETFGLISLSNTRSSLSLDSVPYTELPGVGLASKSRSNPVGLAIEGDNDRLWRCKMGIDFQGLILEVSISGL